MEIVKKNKLFLYASLALLVILLVVFVSRINKTQQFQSRAQTSNADACISAGHLVMTAASCTPPTYSVVDTYVIGDGINVCCRTAEVIQPTVTLVLGCPVGFREAPRDECPGQNIQPIIISGTGTVNGDEIRPGIVCCPIVVVTTETPTPTVPVDIPTPTPTDCPLPNAPVISNIQITCPEGCSGGTP